MANGRATAKTRERAERAKAYLAAVNQQSIERTVEVAQTLDTRGGNMRAETGWLWHSVVAQIGGTPPAATENPYPGGEGLKVTYDAGPVNLLIKRAKITDTVFVFWTANYARHREYRDGFRRLAAQRWRQIVEQVKKENRGLLK